MSACPDPQLRWLRLWTDIVSDPKIKMLAFEDRWHFVAILCMKRKGDLEGASGDLLERMVGVTLGLGNRERDEVKRRLLEVNLIENDWQPVAWSRRQFASDFDRTAAERQRRHRERAKVTRDSRVTNGRVTTLETEQSRADTEQNGDKKHTARAPTAKRLSEDFGLSPERRAVALAESVNPEREFAKFRDYWWAAAGANARKHDWDAAWRNWCRKASEISKTKYTEEPTRESIEQRDAKRLAEFRERTGFRSESARRSGIQANGSDEDQKLGRAAGEGAGEGPVALAGLLSGSRGSG